MNSGCQTWQLQQFQVQLFVSVWILILVTLSKIQIVQNVKTSFANRLLPVDFSSKIVTLDILRVYTQIHFCTTKHKTARFCSIHHAAVLTLIDITTTN